MKEIPRDPIICLSFINTQLRDFYSDLDMLCDDLCVDKQELVKKMNEIGYFYEAELNQFR